MADDPNPALRAELIAARAVVDPQIRGMHDLVTVSITDELRTKIDEEIVIRERRRDLIQAVIDALDSTLRALEALEADGYPKLPEAIIDPALFSELQGEEADLDAAVAVFTPNVATTLSVSLGEPTPKT